MHKSYTEVEKKALAEHGLTNDKPSQLSDAFVLGLRFNQRELNTLAKGCKFTMVKVKKHNALTDHDNEMVRQRIVHCDRFITNE